MSIITDLVKRTKEYTVLYVEDDNDIRSNIAELLDNLFKDVTSAVDGLDGLEKYKKQRFDLVITDIKMPKMSGIALIKEIQAINPTQKIIITTAHDEKEYQVQFEALNIKSVLQKPITFDALVEMLTNATK